MGWSSSTNDQPGMADEAQSAPLRFPRDIRRVKMSTGAFGFVLAICGVILGPILFGWALGMAYTGGTRAEQMLEITAAALIAYTLFGMTLFREMWKDAERDRVDRAFRAETRDEIASLKKDMAHVMDQLRARGMLGGARPAPDT